MLSRRMNAYPRKARGQVDRAKPSRRFSRWSGMKIARHRDNSTPRNDGGCIMGLLDGLPND
jgi:hypothetical protein